MCDCSALWWESRFKKKRDCSQWKKRTTPEGQSAGSLPLMSGKRDEQRGGHQMEPELDKDAASIRPTETSLEQPRQKHLTGQLLDIR